MRGFTRVERLLLNAGIGDAIVTGFQQSTKADGQAVRAARALQAVKRAEVGYARQSADILTSGASQSKLGKNTVFSLGLMLTPERGMMAASLADVRTVFRLTGGVNVCPMASKGCALACLSRSGQSGMPAQQRAQAVRTAFMLAYPRECGLIIGAELRRAVIRHGRVNMRLNTTSDIRWELIAPQMIETLSDAGVRFYDYTAWTPSDRIESGHYSLTYSAKESVHTSDGYLAGILSNGGTVAVPFTTSRGADLPTSWLGFPVIDGDKSDERYRDPRGVVVGLRAKGHEWKRDNTAGFIREAMSA